MPCQDRRVLESKGASKDPRKQVSLGTQLGEGYFAAQGDKPLCVCVFDIHVVSTSWIFFLCCFLIYVHVDIKKLCMSNLSRELINLVITLDQAYSFCGKGGWERLMSLHVWNLRAVI